MGNNASSTRKSSFAHRHAAPFRKSYQSQSNHHNLEEEFSDLILHEVKKQKEQLLAESSASDHTYQATPTSVAAGCIGGKDRFTDGLIEDEFNELNQGMLENEELQRNILPVDGSDEDTAMQIDDAAGSVSPALIDDITKVDFTKISLPAMARQPTQPVAPVPPGNSSTDLLNTLVPVRIKWVNQTQEVISKVAIIGSFSKWRDVMKLKRSTSKPNEFSTTVKLPLGVHKLLYVINNEYRVLELLPTATDQEGILFNWFEVLDPQHLFSNSANPMRSGADDVNIVQTAGEHDSSVIQRKSNSFLMRISKKEKEAGHEHVEHVEVQPPQQPFQGDYAYMSQDSSHTHLTENSYTSLLDALLYGTPKIEYSSDIPEMLVDYNYFKEKSPDYELPEPPQLPAHLNNVLLNKMSSNHPPAQTLSIPQMGEFNKRPTLRRADSSYYASNVEAYHRAIPNHVILNHLMTTSIRNDVLTVACITRYSGKFVTQIMHSPADSVLEAR